MFGVWQGTAPRQSHTNFTPCRSSAIFCHTIINPYDAVIGLWWHPWTNRRGSSFHGWKSYLLLSLKASVCAGMSSQVMAGSEPLHVWNAHPKKDSFVRGYAPPCYFLSSRSVSTCSRWASAWSHTLMKNQPGTHMLHLLSCLLHFFFLTPPPQNDFSFTVQAVIFHITSQLLVSVFSARMWNIFLVMFQGLCCMRLWPGYIWKSAFSLITSPHDFYYLHSFLHTEEQFYLGWSYLVWILLA